MGIHIDMVRAGAQLSGEHISERIVSFDTPRTARPRAAIATAQAKVQPVADIRSLDRIGWAFSIATLIVWAIAAALVRAAAP